MGHPMRRKARPCDADRIVAGFSCVACAWVNAGKSAQLRLHHVHDLDASTISVIFVEKCPLSSDLTWPHALSRAQPHTKFIGRLFCFFQAPDW
eukprot:3226977-Amphidinium_carterae.1